MFFGKRDNPCSDCSDGYCTMNCGPCVPHEQKENANKMPDTKAQVNLPPALQEKVREVSQHVATRFLSIPLRVVLRYLQLSQEQLTTLTAPFDHTDLVRARSSLNMAIKHLTKYVNAQATSKLRT